MTLTEEQIAEIRARVEAATPGPWRLYGVALKEPDVDFLDHAREDVPLLLSALEAEKKRADEAEAAREAMREDRDSQQRVCIAVMTERDALRARVAELEGAAGRGTILIRTIPGETGDAIREWSCSECYPGWFDTEDTIAHRDNCIFAALKGASHEQG